MKRLISSLVIAGVTSLAACTLAATDEQPALVYMVVADVPCKEAIQSMTQKLEKDGFPFDWTDRGKGLLSVGPITEDLKSHDRFTRMKQSYHLSFSCHEEAFTNVANQAELEGLDMAGNWVAIVDHALIEKYGMRFLDRLKL
jgi:hypothetical protein|tara:strand:+ start:123 stop:548 length:426 start_codon:yes stop_codon:yes gene_type:complete